jgi:hypothetical protein
MAMLLRPLQLPLPAGVAGAGCMWASCLPTRSFPWATGALSDGSLSDYEFHYRYRPPAAATTGLHFDDIKKLLRVLDRLVDGGNTVVVIEHNLDVIKTADWVIALGPEGGDGGGKIVAEGTPEQVAAVKGSYTGRFLGPLLPKAAVRRAAR